MLSPLSWWNDAFINIPLAQAFAWAVSFIYKPAFPARLIPGYWITNLLGFVLMHKGARHIFSEKPSETVRRDLFTDAIISPIYTAVIVALIQFGILKPFAGYFKRQ